MFASCNPTNEFLVFIGVIFVGLLGLCEYLGITNFLSRAEPLYGYDELTGPYVWKNKFPRATGKAQSPINIEINRTIVVPSETMPKIKFSTEYYVQPQDMAIYNDGHTVILCAMWENNCRPTVSGGPLCQTFQFLNACFRWGACDGEGSEHTLNSRRYVMELQAAHIKEGYVYKNIETAASDNALLMISYFFELSPVDNIYMDPLVNSLKSIKFPFSRVCMEPTPLSWLIPPFTCQYFAYCGSLTYPPCTEGVQWIIQPEPLSISSRQLQLPLVTLSIVLHLGGGWNLLEREWTLSFHICIHVAVSFGNPFHYLTILVETGSILEEKGCSNSTSACMVPLVTLSIVLISW
ncbi:carbonic anhydrase 1-like [Agrilus planipennis]|uniref:Carbonic anhydrase 1-like n=1 Tax=Agrilus planipennis TaxID=224129 RepID=A0A1W4X7M1_AGRPL|nr:carbonic anhydrase 1-like [Agrilus planipennis]